MNFKRGRDSGLAALLALVVLSQALPAQEPGTASTITLRLVPDPEGGRDLLLRADGTNVEDLYGLSFDVEFPKKRLRWKRNSRRAGSLLSADETVETVALDRQKPRGVLHVGASRLGAVEGANGSGPLVEIGFVNRKKSGPRDLVLIEPRAFASDTQPLEDIAWVVEPFEDGSSGD